MIRRLIILLLIVGCAPTTTNYHIGMSEKEFLDNNATNVELSDNKRHYSKNSTGNTYYENKGTLNEYMFGFNNDTLAVVYRGIWSIPYKDAAN